MYSSILTVLKLKVISGKKVEVTEIAGSLQRVNTVSVIYSKVSADYANSFSLMSVELSSPRFRRQREPNTTSSTMERVFSVNLFKAKAVLPIRFLGRVRTLSEYGSADRPSSLSVDRLKARFHCQVWRTSRLF